MQYEPKHIVIDGGPCAGKTTILSIAVQTLQQKGFLPIIVPEAATLLIGNGIRPNVMEPADFQGLVARLQDRHEMVWRYSERLYRDQRPVFLYDRGILSGGAYLDHTNDTVDMHAFEQQVLVPAIKEDLEGANARYSAIIHLVTAADGAEEYYTLQNNKARSEGPELARLLDHKTKQCWLGHGHLRIISNRNSDGTQKSFEAKTQQAIDQILETLGMPIPIEAEDKYLLSSDFDPRSITVPYVKIDIEQTYIRGGASTEDRVRERRLGIGVSYYHTTKWPGPRGNRFETERRINRSLYRRLLEQRRDDCETIRKTRYCFLYQDQYFELDIFKDKLAGTNQVERERTVANPTTVLPEFLGPAENVTGNPLFTNFGLARYAKNAH